MPSFSATRAACNGAAPPKAISVRGRRSFPLSMACTRAAFAMFSSTISLMPSAACSVARLSAAPIRSATACLAPATSSGILPPEKVDARDRAAAGADLDHFDHRDAQRQPAAFEKAVDPRHLEGARGLRLRLVDEADLRGRAAHVEGYDLIEPVLTRDAGGKDRAARRPGFDQSDREANGGLAGCDPPARG